MKTCKYMKKAFFLLFFKCVDQFFSKTRRSFKKKKKKCFKLTKNFYTVFHSFFWAYLYVKTNWKHRNNGRVYINNLYINNKWHSESPLILFLLLIPSLLLVNRSSLLIVKNIFDFNAVGDFQNIIYPKFFRRLHS